MHGDKQKSKTRRVNLMEDPPPAAKSESRSRLALRALKNAAAERKVAQTGGRDTASNFQDAAGLAGVASMLMSPRSVPTLASGEVAFVAGMPGPSREVADTLCNPDQAAIDASVARTDLLLSVPGDIVPLAVDAATSAMAANSLEKMLTHQLALIHTLAMKAGSRAVEFERRAGPYDDGLKEADSVEFSRLAQATGRLSSTFQEGILTLQRLRNGSSQTVTVRHVTVKDGGQAIIGNLQSGRGSTAKPGRGKQK
jgi:hypothetical protein